MTYIVEKHAGPWLPGTEVEESELKAHPFHEKFLKSGSIVKADPQARSAAKAEAKAARIAELQVKIAELTAELDALNGEAVEPTAPGLVSVDLDPENQPSQAEAEETRAEGKEVIQPQPGDPLLGEVEPGEAAEAEKKSRK